MRSTAGVRVGCEEAREAGCSKQPFTGAACVFVGTLALLGCGTDEKYKQDDRGGEAVQEPARDPVVARVDGSPIFASAVARWAALTGTSADAAVNALIDRELLVREARRRGHDNDPDVIEEARRASVRMLLETTFERDYTADEVTDSELREVYDRQRHRFVHPERRAVVHALAVAQSNATPERRSRSRAWAERLADEVSGLPLTPEEFEARAKREPKEGVEVRVERLTTIRHGHTVEPFARATFALEHPGSTSAPVETEFGYHVIHLVSIEPAADRPFSEVRAEILRDAWPDLRRQAFERFFDEIRETHQVSINDALFEEPSGS